MMMVGEKEYSSLQLIPSPNRLNFFSAGYGLVSLSSLPPEAKEHTPPLAVMVPSVVQQPGLFF